MLPLKRINGKATKQPYGTQITRDSADNNDRFFVVQISTCSITFGSTLLHNNQSHNVATVETDTFAII
jgi:hypothetical protein